MTHSFRLFLLVLTLAGPALGQLPVETGSFRNFMGGVEAACAYDNWISHISEGIARPGYNVYAPSTLDPQTTGFGSFEVLLDNAHGNAVLQLFADLADSLLQGRGEGALARLQEEPTVDYELVLFQDTETGRSFHVLRELLDLSYFDANNTGTADDVAGSFHHGWGIFVFAIDAPRPHWMVQAPHPNDDYPSPYIATEVFLQHGAGLLMINGAGREVAYTGNPGAYTNGASLSDPSRNCLTPFATIHERTVLHWRGQDLLERTIQVHTYDDLSHRDLKSAVLSGGRTRRLNHAPIYDTGNGPTGLLNNLLHPVHAANSFGFTHNAVALADYVSTQSLNTIRVDGGQAGQEITLSISPDLWGWPNSCQEVDSHPAGFPDCHTDEAWIHAEFDELPTISHTRGFSFWYQTSSGTPVTWENFSRSRTYFAPMFTALAQAEDSLAAGLPTAAPTDPANLAVAEVAVDALRLTWTPLWSSNFETYELLADPSGEITPDALVFDQEEFEAFCWAPLNSVWVGGLDYQTTYALALRGRDQEGRISNLSNVATGMPDDLEPPLFQARYPAGHSRFWVQPGGGPVQVRVWDEHHLVDLSSLQVRVDQNGNGSYDGTESWMSAVQSGFSADTTVTVVVPVSGTGIKRLEFRAHDNQHAIYGCSGSDDTCGIGDDWRVGVDGTAPALFTGLALAGLPATGNIILSWPAQNPDSTFLTYEIALAPAPFSSFNDAAVRYTRTQLSTLGQPAITGISLPPQPWPGDSLWIRARAVDAAGNLGAGSATLAFRYYSSSWLDLTLSASLQMPTLQLSWQWEALRPGMTVSGWWLHQVEDPWQRPDDGTRLLFTLEPQATLPIAGLMPGRFFRVTADLLFQVAAQSAAEVDQAPSTVLQAAWAPRPYLPPGPSLPEDSR
jgi:hypothetical protein